MTMVDAEYRREVEAWRSRLDQEIRGERGLLALSGLFWLQKGINTIGSSRDCSICLPKPVPRLLGAFDFDGTQVTFSTDVGQAADLNGVPLREPAQLKFEDEDGASLIRSGDLAMAVTRHGDRVGLRLWNAARSRAFPPRRWFPFHVDFSVKGTYTPYPVPVSVSLPDSVRGTQQGYMQGYVSFRLHGKAYRLDAAETDEGCLFVPFRDSTNGAQTYPEGRYLQTGVVVEDGEVLVDFNKAWNPPSAFTEFVACTFAPKGNTLACPVEAGECYSPIAGDGAA
ncbi:MAG TPA: DUF1684 domain-containing protein [Anaerolineales bacterium]